MARQRVPGAVAGQDGGQDGGYGNLHMLQDGGQYSGGYLWSFPSLWTQSGPVLFRPTLPGWMHAFPYNKTPLIGGTKFPDGAWDPLLKAGAIAAAFAAEPGWTTDCDPRPPPEKDEQLVTDEAILEHYVSRGDRIDADLGPAITLQAQDITQYWANLLGCSAASRPNTWTLVLIGLQVGGLIAAYYKLKYMRARPAQVSTAIAPMIATPPHPSYPSGHALQAFLIADCVTMVVGAMRHHCEALATQIARNRERAGVHFRTDTEASLRIRPKAMEILVKVPAFNAVFEAAKREWERDAHPISPQTPSKPQELATVKPGNRAKRKKVTMPA